MSIILAVVLIIQALFIFRFHFDISAVSPFLKPLPWLRQTTDPFIKPLVPHLRDPAHAQVLPVIVAAIFTVAVVLILGIRSPFNAMGQGLALFFSNWLNIIFIVVIVNAILSWVNLFKIESKILENVRYLAHHFCEPMLKPLRQLLPPMNGIDFSPMILIVGISVLLSVI